MLRHEYKIYFAARGQTLTRADVSKFFSEDCPFPGFTLTEAFGYWEGETEKAYVLTVLTERTVQDTYMKVFAQKIKETFSQMEVLVTHNEITSFTV